MAKKNSDATLPVDVTGATLGDAWEASIKALVGVRRPLLEGEVGGPYIEALNMIIHARSTSVSPVVSPRYRYAFLLSRPRSPAEPDEISAIRDRLEYWPAGDGVLNQLEGIVSLLKRNLYSRRAVASLWNPCIDSTAFNAISPCILQFYARGPREAPKLGLTVLVRSSDAWVGAMADMWYFSRIQASIADAVEIQPGPDFDHPVSYHMYEQDVPAGRELLLLDGGLE